MFEARQFPCSPYRSVEWMCRSTVDGACPIAALERQHNNLTEPVKLKFLIRRSGTSTRVPLEHHLQHLHECDVISVGREDFKTRRRHGKHGPSGGIPTQSPPKKMKKIATSGSSSNKNNDDVRSIAELRQTVVIGQRLSAPVKPGRQPGGGGGGSRSSPKRNSFWT